jgi:hypothetical protein
LLRTDQNGTLTVIDYGMYRLVNVTAADRLAELGHDAHGRAAPLSLEVAQGWAEDAFLKGRSFAMQLKWCQQELELELRRSFGLEPRRTWAFGKQYFRCRHFPELGPFLPYDAPNERW